MDPTYRIAMRSALQTVMTLFGGILVGTGLGNLVFHVLPGHDVSDPSTLHVIVAAIPLLIGLLAGGAGWGIAMGRLAGTSNRRRMALAGILGFLPITLIMTFGLLELEPIAIEEFGDRVPLHRLFTLLFVPTAFLIAAISAWAIGRGLRDDALAWSLFWRVGLTASATFLAVDIIMESAGWVVGAPGAGERATMITVMSLGNLAAALSGGGLLGLTLAKRSGAAGRAERQTA